MKRFFKLALALGFLVIGVLAVLFLIQSKPEAEKRKDEDVVRPVVEMVEVEFEEKTIELPSQGIVEAKQRTVISAEVGGRVMEVSPRFDVGQSFAGEGAGEEGVLVSLDKTDYEAAIKAAELAVADARLSLADAELNVETEEAKATQALNDWRRLGDAEKEPSSLTLREPQLKKARAAMEAARATLAKAEADLAKANKDLDRTEIRAPFDGVLTRTDVEVGAFVTPGMPVAEIYSKAPFEVRLPLALRDYDQLQRDSDGTVKGEVTFTIQSPSGDRKLTGTLVRTEGEVDRRSRSIYVVAQVDKGQVDPLLRPGLFVKASIQGVTHPKLAPVPFRSFTDRPDEVVVLRYDPSYNEEGELIEGEDNLYSVEKRKVNVVKREKGQGDSEDIVWIDAGLEEGERVAWTQLPQFSSQTRELDPEDPKEDERVEGGTVRDWPPVREVEGDLSLDEGLSVTKP